MPSCSGLGLFHLAGRSQQILSTWHTSTWRLRTCPLKTSTRTLTVTICKGRNSHIKLEKIGRPQAKHMKTESAKTGGDLSLLKHVSLRKTSVNICSIYIVLSLLRNLFVPRVRPLLQLRIEELHVILAVRLHLTLRSEEEEDICFSVQATNMLKMLCLKQVSFVRVNLTSKREETAVWPTSWSNLPIPHINVINPLFLRSHCKLYAPFPSENPFDSQSTGPSCLKFIQNRTSFI